MTGLDLGEADDLGQAAAVFAEVRPRLFGIGSGAA
jgi:hypothetical protein